MGLLTLKKGIKGYHLQRRAKSNEPLLQNIELYSQPVCELGLILFLQKTTANPVVGIRRKSAREDWERWWSFGSSNLVPVSSSSFCFEANPKKSIVPNPFPVAFCCYSPKAAEPLGRCLPQPVWSTNSPFSFPSPVTAPSLGSAPGEVSCEAISPLQTWHLFLSVKPVCVCLL